MQQTMKRMAEEYKEMAETISLSAEEAAFDIAAQGYIQDALMRLYYLKALEQKLGKLQGELTEQTDKETFAATMEAETVVNAATDVVFGLIEKYAEGNRKFRKAVDKTSADTDSKDKDDLLRQLYRCEGILRMAYRTSRHVPIYSAGNRMLEHLEGLGDYEPEVPEDTVYKDTGVDLYALQEVRKKLIAAIDQVKSTDSK